ncbi:hypothetical protein HYW61_01865 [candidate division WWE3 bacterium]|nr:hypothetical protein [candidate division WWE3 bacterium]
MGIGTSSPNNYLDVRGSAAFGGGAGGPLPQSNSAYFSGNVGIGTTAPDSVFEVETTDANATPFRVTSASTPLSHIQQWYESTSIVGAIGDNGITAFGGNTVTSNQLTIYASSATVRGVAIRGAASQTANLQEWQNSSGTALTVIDEVGNVGIGTTNPAQLLHLSDAASPTITIVDTTNTMDLRLGATNTTGRIGTASNHDLELMTNSTVAATINTSGNVGIGTTAPSQKLEVFGNAAITNSGTLTIGGLTYTFPATQSANALLQTNGSGTLSWSSATGSGVQGYWNRLNSTLVPTTIADNIGTTGNIGIGTTSPLNRLDISGSVAIGSLPTTILPQSNMLTVSGNVGIGTTNPTSKLQIAGSILPSADDSYDIGSNVLRWQDIYLGPGTLHIGTSTSDEYAIGFNTTQNFLGFNLNGSGNDEVVFDGGGNVGIGTTAPVQALDIVGVTNVSTGFRIGNAATSGNFLRGNGTNFVSSAIQSTDVSGFISGNPNSISKFTGVNSLGNSLLFDNGTILGTTANVGIGTTNPLNKLDVSGSVAFGSLPTLALPQSNSAYFSGNVGIGTTAPSQKLDVAGSLNLSSGSSFFINGTSVLNGTTLGSGVTSSSLTSVGTIATGVWQGTAVGTTYGGTGQNFGSTAQGNILYFSGAGTMATLAPGTANQVLITAGAGANPSWSFISGSNITADSLDFTEFRDAMSLDASTSINLAGLPVLTSPDLIFR